MTDPYHKWVAKPEPLAVWHLVIDSTRNGSRQLYACGRWAGAQTLVAPTDVRGVLCNGCVPMARKVGSVPQGGIE